MEKRRARKAVVCCVVLAFGITLGVMSQFGRQAGPVFPIARADVVRAAAGLFAPLGERLGVDWLDYAKAQLMSTNLDGETCTWMVVPLAEGSPAHALHRRMGADLTWEEAGPLPLGALYFVPGENDLVHGVPEGEPLLLVMRGWGDGVLMDTSGEIVRPVTLESYRGDEWRREAVGVNAGFHGIMCHFTTCATASLNEIR